MFFILLIDLFYFLYMSVYDGGIFMCCYYGIMCLYYIEVCKWFLCKINIDVNFD